MNIRKAQIEDFMSEDFIENEKKYYIVKEMLKLNFDISIEDFFETLFLSKVTLTNDLVRLDLIQYLIKKYEKTSNIKIADKIKQLVNSEDLRLHRVDLPQDINFWGYIEYRDIQENLLLKNLHELPQDEVCNMTNHLMTRWDFHNDDDTSIAQYILEFNEYPDKKFIQFVLQCITKAKSASRSLHILKAWSEFIFKFVEKFPVEIFFSIWNNLDAEKKIEIFVRAITLFSETDSRKLFYKYCSEYNVEYGDYIFSTYKEIANAKFQVDKKIFDDDTLILLMYALAKNSIMNKHILSEIQNVITAKSEPRTRIVFNYFLAGYYNKILDFNERNECIAESERIFFEEIFTDRIVNETIGNFDKCSEEIAVHDFFQNRLEQELKFLLPPCTGDDLLFCQAVTWKSQNSNYCPTLNSKPKPQPQCMRIEPNISLPIKKWSLIDFCRALNLKVREKEQENAEFFTQLGGAFNRLWSLSNNDSLRCRSCKKYMKPKLYATKWKYTENEEYFSNHFSVTTFECSNTDCEQKGKSVYLHFCWSCKKEIDSRDCPVSVGRKIFVENNGKVEKNFRGYHSCLKCGAGYKQNKATHWTGYRVV